MIDLLRRHKRNDKYELECNSNLNGTVERMENMTLDNVQNKKEEERKNRMDRIRYAKII